VAEEDIADKMAQLRRENQELKAEIERLRRMLEEALRAKVNDKRPPSRDGTPKPNPKNRDGRAARSMVDVVVGQSRSKSTK
jgi:regulator of replication initiation timing